MAASIRKNLTFFILNQASPHKNGGFCISPASVSLSLSLRLFSTETPTHLDIVNPAVYDIMVHRHGFPTEFASRVASKLCNMKHAERVDSMLSFLKSSGFSSAQLQKILRCRPGYLCFSLEGNIKPKIKGLQEEGFSSGDIPTMMSRCPALLHLSLNNNIVPSLSLLRDLLGSTTALVSVVRRSPRLLTSNMETTVVPNVEFLKSCGLSTDRIRLIFHSHAQVFALKPRVLRALVDKAQRMGLTAASKAFTYAIPTIASMTNTTWELKLQAFRGMGFSESDIPTMFIREPRVFCLSTEKLKKITEGLVGTGKFDLSSIVKYPTSLRFSMEKRYEPRFRILSILESRRLIQNWPPLPTLSSLTNAKFYERFVSPYLDHLDGVCIPKLR